MRKRGGNNITLGPQPLLLAEEERVQGHVGNLGDLEPDAGNVTDGVALPTESGDENFVVLLHKIEAAVLGHECRDLLSVLDQLDTDALSDGRVRLLGLDTDLFEDNPLGMRGTAERIGLPPGAQMCFLVVQIGPDLGTAVLDVLTGRPESS